MDSKSTMKGMMELLKQMEKALDQIEERQRRWHTRDPKKQVKPRKQIEERKSIYNDSSFVHSSPYAKSSKTKQVKPSKLDAALQEFKEGNAVLEAMIKKKGKGKLKSVSAVQEAEKSESVIPIFFMEKNVSEEEKSDYELSKVFPMEQNLPEEGKHESELSNVSPMEENIQEEEQQKSELSNVSSVEESSPEKEKQDSDFSDVSLKEESIQRGEEQVSEFPDVCPKKENDPGKEKRIYELSNVFLLQQNIREEEAIDFILPIPIVFQTNHVLDLRTNLFEEEGNDRQFFQEEENDTNLDIPYMNLDSTLISPNQRQNGSAASTKINSWRPNELNYARWGVFKVMKNFNKY